MKVGSLTLILLLAVAFSSGCAYRYFLGMHGPTVKAQPEIHNGITKDAECLDCHKADSGSGAPATSHPGFKGCLKCHND